MEHKAFEKAHLFLLQACYSDLINVDPQSANAPLMSKLPWDSYEANAWGARIRAQDLKKTLTEHAKQSGRKIKLGVSQSRL